MPHHFRARYGWLGRGRGGGSGQLFPLLGSSEEARRVLKPHARGQLSHLHTCGFSLRPEHLYSETAPPDPTASARTREQPPGGKHCPITRMLIILLPLPGVWGNSRYRELTATVGKDQHIPSLASSQFIAALVVIQGPPPSPCPAPRRGQQGLRH